MTATANGRLATPADWVDRCPACSHHRPVPANPPQVWAYTCANCGTDIEVNLTNWHPDDTPPTAA